MNLDEAVRKIAEKGFTERQARFLVLVARHSGVCVMRQYAAFAGIVFGHKTRKFFAKLERLGWVSTYECAHNRWRIYHLRHRDVYDAIGDPHSRLRRPPTVPQALERLMILDALLKEPNLVWLASADEKLAQLSALTRAPVEAMPQGRSTVNGVAQVRYFPDRLPLGVDPAGRWVCVYLLTQRGDRNLRLFLERHLPLLAALPTWTLRIAVPPHLAEYGTRLVAEVREQLRSCLQGHLLEDIRWFFERRRSRRADVGPDYEDAVFTTLSAIFEALDSGVAVIEPLVLPHAYSYLTPLVAIA